MIVSPIHYGTSSATAAMRLRVKLSASSPTMATWNKALAMFVESAGAPNGFDMDITVFRALVRPDESNRAS